eukprot:COSAG06_NODE_5887_length_3228_cov_14.702461_2_plen_39_part_00
MGKKTAVLAIFGLGDVVRVAHARAHVPSGLSMCGCECL